MKQVFLAILVLIIGTNVVLGACANREKADDTKDFFDDVKCGLSSAGEKIKDSVSTVGTSLRDGTSKAFDVLGKAAVKTGSVIRDGLNVAAETGKSSFEIVRDVIQGKKSSEIKNGEGNIDVRSLNANEP